MAAFAYVFFEWLFIVTKPSFMSALGFPTKLGILIFSSALLFALASFLLFPLLLAGILPMVRRYTYQLTAIGAIIPAVILASLSLLLVDNFTYTIFTFGIVTSRARCGGSMLLCLFLWSSCGGSM